MKSTETRWQDTGSPEMPWRLVSVIAVGAAVIAFAQTRAADQLTPINLRQVKVSGEIGRHIDITVNNNLLVLDADNDFLQPFRNKTSKSGYTGLGKFIDSLVRFAAYTNDKQVLALKKHVIAETIRTQEPDGYIGILVTQSRMWQLWDIHEMSYIVLGLTSDYEYFGEKPSLEAAQKLADYIIERWSAEPNGQPGGGWISVYVATTSFEAALLALYEQTKDQRYPDFCVKHRKLPEWNVGIVLGRHGPIDGHAYAYICRCLAQLELYRIRPDEKLLRKSRLTMDFLTRQDGLVITGACGYQECWHDNQQGFFKLGETCATAYLIRLLDNMLRLEGDTLYGDMMERTIYNTLFAAQSPDGRNLRYYSPFEGKRVYFDKDTYCCPCNFRRIIAELPTMVYYRCGGGLAINLYTPSTAKVELGGGLSLAVRQETNYPTSGEVIIHLNPSKPARFLLRLRIPRWCTMANVVVNGEMVNMAVRGGSFFTIERQWKASDRVELQMPMEWRVIKGRKAQAGRVAVMRGPVLFCLNPERNKNVKIEELKLLRLELASPQGPDKDNTVRPDGMACRVRAWNPNSYVGGPDMKLILTEFTDPGGQLTYFLVPNPYENISIDDELIEPDRGR